MKDEGRGASYVKRYGRGRASTCALSLMPTQPVRPKIQRRAAPCRVSIPHCTFPCSPIEPQGHHRNVIATTPSFRLPDKVFMQCLVPLVNGTFRQSHKKDT